MVETRGYNSDNTLSTISFGGSGTAIGNLTYTWDSNKNKTSETTGGVMSPYSFTQAGTTYDAEDRLTGFARAATSGTPQLSQSWNLSAVGDWNSVTTNGTVQSRTHGPTHELLTAGGQSVTHDTKGNMLLIPASVRANSSPLVLTWDFDNRMVSADVGADSVIDVTHQYDALGRRVARTASGSTTVFVQVDQQTICDYASGAAPASSTYRYLYGSYIDEPIVRIATSNSEMTWYHRNQQYSIVACTDSTGAATERYAYTAYGLPTITDGSGTVRTSSTIGNRYTYTGREWDGVLGLYHYRARTYEATVGRFCSRDPIGYRLLSLYLYVRNNPQLLNDPSGHMPQMLAGALAGCGVAGFWSAVGSVFINLPNIGNPTCFGCSVGCDSLGGCIGGALFGAVPGFWSGCIGGAIGSLVSSLCNSLCQGDPIDGCDFFGLAVNLVLGCIGGATGDADGKFEGLMEAIGLNVSVWTSLCSAAVGDRPSLGGPACCTFLSGGTIWSESVSCGFGVTPASCCASAADGWLWDYHVLASRAGKCSGGT